MHTKVQSITASLGNKPKKGQWHVLNDPSAFKLNVERFNRLCLEQPDLTELGTRLLTVGGSVVCVVGIEEDLALILKSGAAWTPHKRQIIMNKGLPSRCHENVLALWEANPHTEVCTGYALSNDGIWRCHSWCLLKNQVIETTIPRLAYYGAVLSVNQIKQRISAL